jgi:hypothetical protein
MREILGKHHDLKHEKNALEYFMQERGPYIYLSSIASLTPLKEYGVRLSVPQVNTVITVSLDWKSLSFLPLNLSS